MATFIQAAKKNPLQAITVGIAVAGVVVSLFNFYLLNSIAPIERRVVAIEESLDGRDELIQEFRVSQQELKEINRRIGSVEAKIDRLLLK